VLIQGRKLDVHEDKIGSFGECLCYACLTFRAPKAILTLRQRATFSVSGSLRYQSISAAQSFHMLEHNGLRALEHIRDLMEMMTKLRRPRWGPNLATYFRRGRCLVTVSRKVSAGLGPGDVFCGESQWQ
jgi:hypothetical protein